MKRAVRTLALPRRRWQRRQASSAQDSTKTYGQALLALHPLIVRKHPLAEPAGALKAQSASGVRLGVAGLRPAGAEPVGGAR